jgi:hypothetical protein
MGFLRPPGFAAVKSWFVRAVNSRLGKSETAVQTQPHTYSPSVRTFGTQTRTAPSQIRTPKLRPANLYGTQTRSFHQFHIPKFSKPPPNFVRVKLPPTSYFLRSQVGAFPRNPWSMPGARGFHNSPASSAIVLNQIAHSVSTALRTGLHPAPKLNASAALKAQILAQVAARAACQSTDGPAGYIRFTLSPPAWTPTESDLSDPDIVGAIDTHIAELQRVKTALLKLKQYGDFPVRTVLPSNPEARIDVLFRGATAEDVARWNKNEFKLGSGQVGGDQVFCAGNFEEYVRWSEILDVEKKVEKEAPKGNGELLKFWEELNQLEGRIQ